MATTAPSGKMKGVRLQPHQQEALRIAAERAGVSQSALIRLAIGERLERTAGGDLLALWRGEMTP